MRLFASPRAVGERPKTGDSLNGDHASSLPKLHSRSVAWQVVVGACSQSNRTENGHLSRTGRIKRPMIWRTCGSIPRDSLVVTGGSRREEGLGYSFWTWTDKRDQESLHDLERRGCPLPKTIVVRTGRGAHIYFQLSLRIAPRIRNSAGRIAPGLDVRGEGGYVVVPPSVHATGAPYEFIDDIRFCGRRPSHGYLRR